MSDSRGFTEKYDSNYAESVISLEIENVSLTENKKCEPLRMKIKNFEEVSHVFKQQSLNSFSSFKNGNRIDKYFNLNEREVSVEKINDLCKNAALNIKKILKKNNSLMIKCNDEPSLFSNNNPKII